MCDSYLASNNLLQGILTLDISVVSHYDHDHRHEFIHQGQRAVFQLSCQDTLWMHVRDFLDFLQGNKKKNIQTLDKYKPTL